MPRRIIRAYTGHVSNNLTIWIILSGATFAALTAAFIYLGKAHSVGNYIPIAGCFFGALIMLQAEKERPVILDPTNSD